ncbi:MAG: glycosyl hydrolase [Pedobacter sp.]|nr:glycosyl hydrolase [Pedobacter sp.]
MFNFIFLTGLLLVNPKDNAKPIPKAVKSISVSKFLNSIGVNSSISVRGETLEQTSKAIKYLGIKWIRTGYEGDIPLPDLIQLHQETGIKYSYGLLSGGTDIHKLLKNGKVLSAENALLAFEGLNEPNNWEIVYNGEKGGANNSWKAVANVQKDLYTAVKKDAVLKHYPVWSICENGAQTDNTGLQFLKIPERSPTSMPSGTKFADFAVCHNYFMHPSHPGLYDNQTWNAADPGPDCKVDGLFGNYGITWKSKFKGYTNQQLQLLPRVTTETGMTIDVDRSEEKQARLYLNLYLAQFKRNWSYTAVYLLRDRSDESGNQSFGFYTKDYSPRKSALYLHNMTTILGNPKRKESKPMRSLPYRIERQPSTVHDLLLQKWNGKLALVIWAEKAIGSENVMLTLPRNTKSVKIYDPTIGTAAIASYEDKNMIRLSLSDHPVIIEL